MAIYLGFLELVVVNQELPSNHIKYTETVWDII